MPSLQISAQTLSPELIDDLTLDESTSTSTESATTAGSGANLAISETENENEVTLTFNFSSVPPSWIEDGVSVYGLGGDEDYEIDLTTNKVGDSETYSGKVTVPSSLIADGTNIYVSNPSTETDAKSTFGLFSITSAKLANLKSAGIANFASTLTSVNTEDLPAELTKAIEEAKKKADTKSVSHSCDEFLTQNPVKYGLCNLINMVGESVSGWITNSSNAILNTITDWNNARGDALGKWVANGWGMTRNLVNIIAVIALVIVAFANILHINLNVYAVKRMLPLLIGSVIGANLSLFAIKAINVFSYQIASSIVDPASSGIGDLAKTVSTLFGSLLLAAFGMGDAAAIAFSSVGLVVEAVPVMIILLLIFIAAAVLLLILGFLMYIQPGVVGILTVFAPLAIILGALPFGQGIFKKWLTFTFNWIFMLPVCLLMFALINVLTTKGYGTTESIFALAGQIAILIFAVRVPFMMGGDIMKGWAGAGAFAAKWGWGEASQRIESKGAKMIGEEMAIKRGKGQEFGGAKGSLRYRIGQAILSPRSRIEARKANIEQRKMAQKLAGSTYSGRFSKNATVETRLADNLASDRETMTDANPEARAKQIDEMYKQAGLVAGRGYFSKKDQNQVFKEMIEDFLKVKSKPLKAYPLLSKYGNPDDQAMSKWIGATVVTNQQLRRPIAGAQEIDAIDNKAVVGAFGLSKEDEDRLRGRYQVANGANAQQPVGGVPSGAEIGQTIPVSEPMSEGERISRILDEENEVDDLPSDIKQDVQSETRRIVNDTLNAVGMAVEDGDEEEGEEEGMPVRIVSAPELQVVDVAAQALIEDAAKQVTGSVKKSGAGAKTQSSVLGAVEVAKIAPEDVNKLVDTEGRLRAAGGTTVALGKPTEMLIKRFVITATSGRNITEATARNYYEKNLSELDLYFREISDKVSKGSLKTNQFEGIENDLNKSLAMVRSGQSLNPQQLIDIEKSIRNNVTKAGISITPDASATQIMAHGTMVASALERMRDPQVTRVLEQKGSPQQVQEVIVKQAAQGLIRQTSVDRIGSIASQPQKPVTVKVREVARQVGSFASNSSSAQQWGGLSPVAKQQVATEVARQVVGIKGVDEATVARAIASKLATVRTTGSAPAPQAVQATQPALNVPTQPSTTPQPPATPAPSTPPTPPTPTPPAPTPPSPQTQPPPTPPAR